MTRHREDRVRFPDGSAHLLTREQSEDLLRESRERVVAKLAGNESPTAVWVLVNGRLHRAEQIELAGVPLVYAIAEPVGRPRTGNRRGPDGKVAFTGDELLDARARMVEWDDLNDRPWTLEDMAAIWGKDPRSIRQAFSVRGRFDAEAWQLFHDTNEIPRSLAAKPARGPIRASNSDRNDGSLDE